MGGGKGGWRRGWRERGKKIPTAPVWGCWRNPQSILKDRHSNNWIASHNGMRKEWPTDHKRSTRTGSVTYNKATHTHTHTHTHTDTHRHGVESLSLRCRSLSPAGRFRSIKRNQRERERERERRGERGGRDGARTPGERERSAG